ncbi:MAG: hypothetical protein MJY89_04140 [Bacteroidales bacterium]|nr:hypothetical protein [Bacteroidales bacterium]
MNLIFLPAFLVFVGIAVSCDPEELPLVFEGGEEKSAADSSVVAGKERKRTKLGLSVVGKTGEGIESGELVETLDVFVYGGDGMRELEYHQRVGDGCMDVVSGGECLFVESGSDGPRTAVVVANCPRPFNLKALAKMDSMELLEYEFADEDMSKPLLSGTLTFEPGVDGIVPLRPLLCEVVVSSVSNGLDDYELLEEPSVRLCDMTPSARILQLQEFRPNEVISYGALSKLPNDVGFYTQKPDISLWCYPNDTPENVLGCPRTSMEFNCRILGEECVFPIALPPLGRGSRTNVEIIVNGPEDYNCRVYQN